MSLNVNPDNHSSSCSKIKKDMVVISQMKEALPGMMSEMSQSITHKNSYFEEWISEFSAYF